MEKKSMTALVSAFARAYHARNNEVTIFDDSVAGRLLTDEEYRQIAKSMSDGIEFFHPSFVGGPEQALRWIVDNQLSPSPLGRSAFAEKSLERAIRIGAKQYLIWGAGYDTFAYRQPSWAAPLEIFEVDLPATLRDKRERLKAAGLTPPGNVHYIEADLTNEAWVDTLLAHSAFDRKQISCNSLLGLAYYLSRNSFEGLISVISGLVPGGSSLLFDYPDQDACTPRAGERARKQSMLANAAKERMLAGYSCRDMEQLLSSHEFLIYEHLDPREMTAQYFAAYNQANPMQKMTAFDNVNYCLAVKR